MSLSSRNRTWLDSASVWVVRQSVFYDDDVKEAFYCFAADVDARLKFIEEKMNVLPKLERCEAATSSLEAVSMVSSYGDRVHDALGPSKRRNAKRKERRLRAKNTHVIQRSMILHLRPRSAVDVAPYGDSRADSPFSEVNRSSCLVSWKPRSPQWQNMSANRFWTCRSSCRHG